MPRPKDSSSAAVVRWIERSALMSCAYFFIESSGSLDDNRLRHGETERDVLALPPFSTCPRPAARPRNACLSTNVNDGFYDFVAAVGRVTYAAAKAESNRGTYGD